METLKTALRYAEEVVSGEIPAGRLARLACERFLRDLSNDSPDFPWVLDEAKAERAHRFISRLRHVDGKLGAQGARFELEPWQVFLVCNIFGWVHAETGLRRFLYVYIEVPRGNGKSMLLSAMGLYLAFAEGVVGARVYAAASSEEQARIVYDSSKELADKVPEMKAALGVETMKKGMYQKKNNAEYIPIAAIPRDGKRVYAALYDELHEAKDQALWNSLTQSMGKIPDAITIAITTAGYDLSSFCFRQRSYYVSILEREFEDDRHFGVIYSADPEDDWRSDEALVKANPNLHVSVSLDTLISERNRALRDPYVEYTYKTKRLCLWVNAQDGFYNVTAWAEAARPTMDILGLEGAEWHLGVDLASKQDLAALVATCEKDDVVYVWSHFYIPDAAVQRAHTIPYRQWADLGHITITPGAVTDFGYIERDIIRLAKKLKAKSATFDPMNASQTFVNLRRARVPVIQLRTTVPNMNEPMAESSALLASGRIIHSGNPIMDLHVANTQAYVDRGGRIKPEKPKDPSKKIDGVVAWLNGLSRIMAARVEPKGVRRLIS